MTARNVGTAQRVSLRKGQKRSASMAVASRRRLAGSSSYKRVAVAPERCHDRMRRRRPKSRRTKAATVNKRRQNREEGRVLPPLCPHEEGGGRKRAPGKVGQHLRCPRQSGWTFLMPQAKKPATPVPQAEWVRFFASEMSTHFAWGISNVDLLCPGHLFVARPSLPGAPKRPLCLGQSTFSDLLCPGHVSDRPRILFAVVMVKSWELEGRFGEILSVFETFLVQFCEQNLMARLMGDRGEIFGRLL